MIDDKKNALKTIQSLLNKHFDLDGISQLCFELNITYENLAGNTLNAKTRSLVQYAVKNDCLENLIKVCYEMRPKASWPDLTEIDFTNLSIELDEEFHQGNNTAKAQGKKICASGLVSPIVDFIGKHKWVTAAWFVFVILAIGPVVDLLTLFNISRCIGLYGFALIATFSALIFIICVPCLSYQQRRLDLGILTTIVIILSGIVWFQAATCRSEFSYQVRVINPSGENIDFANVTIYVGGKFNPTQITRTDGIATFSFPINLNGEVRLMRVDKRGYKPSDLTITLKPDKIDEIIIHPQ